jgi:hypothetical protein
MNKKDIAAIIIFIFFLIIVVNIIFHLFYFRNLHSEINTPTPEEKLKVIQILHKNNISTYPRTEFMYVYNHTGRDIVQVNLDENNSTNTYLVDLKSEKIIRR